MKILLVNSPNEVQADHKNAHYSIFPHMGIVQLATRVKEDFQERVEIKIVDGGISSTPAIQDILQSYKPDLVGVSVLTPTYGEGLKIARAAKEIGAKVVMGDDHAIFFPELILNRRPEVDFVIVNDSGEQPFSDLVGALLGDMPLEAVSSLVFRSKNGIQKNPAPKYWLKHQNTVSDLDLIADTLPFYSDRYHEAFGHLHDHKMKVVTINNARGCENGGKRCSYCSIADLAVNTGKPEQFWKTVSHYHAHYGINLFFEVYDSFTADPRYITQLLETMPEDLREKIDHGEIEFMVYARSLGLIKHGNVEKLKSLGVRRVNIGLDSGDSKMLEAQRKNKTTNETNLEALKLLSNAGMTVHGSYILGALGETQESVHYTLDHIRQTLKEVKFSSIEISRLYPLPNSPIWDIMIDFENPRFYRNNDEIVDSLKQLNIHTSLQKRQEIRDKYLGNDIFDTENIIHDWYKNYTHVDETYVIDRIKEIDALITSEKVRTGKNVG